MSYESKHYGINCRLFFGARLDTLQPTLGSISFPLPLVFASMTMLRQRAPKQVSIFSFTNYLNTFELIMILSATILACFVK